MNLVLINGILRNVDDPDVRLHYSGQMKTAGLPAIVVLCRGFGIPDIDTQLRILLSILDEDMQRLRERSDLAFLKEFDDPQDVYNALQTRTKGTKAQDYLLSTMQHLLLIHEEGQAMVHYFRLIDSLVTDVVLDKKLAGAEQRLGHSVESLIAQFNERDRLEAAEDQAAEARSQLLQMKLERDSLEEEIAQGQDGLVGNLKQRLAQIEQKLGVSRDTVSRLQGQVETQRTGYEERVNQLEAQIMELFRMLREVGTDVEGILDSGTTDRRALVATLEKQFQRNKTINALEGRNKLRKSTMKSTGGSKAGEATEANQDTNLNKSKTSGKEDKPTNLTTEGQRASQFMDADDAAAQEQIQSQLAAGSKTVSAFSWKDGILMISTVSAQRWSVGESSKCSRLPSQITAFSTRPRYAYAQSFVQIDYAHAR
jgi:cytokinesis protein